MSVEYVERLRIQQIAGLPPESFDYRFLDKRTAQRDFLRAKANPQCVFGELWREETKGDEVKHVIIDSFESKPLRVK